MSIKVFKCINPKLPGALYMRFENEDLTHVEFGFTKPLKAEQWRWIRERLPQHQHELPELGEGFQIGEVTPKSVREKIIMFCSYYKHYRKINYVAKSQEKNNLKNVPVSDQLLRIFFESPLVDFTLTNYIKRINITKDISLNGRQNLSNNTQKMPDHWDRDYERKLSTEDMVKYHQHLHSLGWRRRNTPHGSVWYETDHN